MTPNDIRESGMLEYYVLGLLSADETQRVEGYLIDFPELKEDVIEIERSMQSFAMENGIKPKRNFVDLITDEIGEEDSTKGKAAGKSSMSSPTQSNGDGSLWRNIALVLGLMTAAASYFGYSKHQEHKSLQSSYQNLKNNCNEEQSQLQEKLEMFEELNDPKNKVLSFAPTKGYDQTDLILHSNANRKKNYIQIRNLPAIANNQAFQLWSLKGPDDKPVPLNVFKDGDNYLIEVDYEVGTTTYAITIEKEEGVSSPTLTRLIGTVTV